MDNNNFIQLKRIFNTLKLIHTCGEDTVLMGKCLEAFDGLINDIQTQNAINIEEE